MTSTELFNLAFQSMDVKLVSTLPGKAKYFECNYFVGQSTSLYTIRILNNRVISFYQDPDDNNIAQGLPILVLKTLIDNYNPNDYKY
jgi:hypothetical protein